MLASSWIAELRDDPAYEAVVTPLLLEMLRPEPDQKYLDLGCGEGRVSRIVRAVGAVVHGLDLNPILASHASPAFVARLPSIPVADASYDGVFAVLAVEHVPDLRLLFEEARRVTDRGGVLTVVLNHPYWTAPGSTPIHDEDGEVLWRPGEYLGGGAVRHTLGDGMVTFHHRDMATLLTTAAHSGWALEAMSETPHHDRSLVPDGVPRLLAIRWSRLEQIPV